MESQSSKSSARCKSKASKNTLASDSTAAQPPSPDLVPPTLTDDFAPINAGKLRINMATAVDEDLDASYISYANQDRISAPAEAPVFRFSCARRGWLVAKFAKNVISPPTHIEKDTATKDSLNAAYRTQHTQELAVMACIGRAVKNAGKAPIPVFVEYFGRIRDAFVVRFCWYGNLELVLLESYHNKVVISNSSLAFACKSLLLALGFLAKFGVVHADIKLTNLFVDRSGQVVLGDFGGATLVGGSYFCDVTKANLGLDQLECMSDGGNNTARFEHDRTCASFALVRMFTGNITASAWDGLSCHEPIFKSSMTNIHKHVIANRCSPLPLPDNQPLLAPIITSLRIPSTSPQYMSISAIMDANKPFLAAASQKRMRHDVRAVIAARTAQPAPSTSPAPVDCEADVIGSGPEAVSDTAAGGKVATVQVVEGGAGAASIDGVVEDAAVAADPVETAAPKSDSAEDAKQIVVELGAVGDRQDEPVDSAIGQEQADATVSDKQVAVKDSAVGEEQARVDSVVGSERVDRDEQAHVDSRRKRKFSEIGGDSEDKVGQGKIEHEDTIEEQATLASDEKGEGAEHCPRPFKRARGSECSGNVGDQGGEGGDGGMVVLDD